MSNIIPKIFPFVVFDSSDIMMIIMIMKTVSIYSEHLSWTKLAVREGNR